MDRGSPWEVIGEWWVPGKSRNKLPGRLEYSPSQGLKLTLSGKLTKQLPPLQVKQLGQLRGRLQSGELFQLIEPRLRLKSIRASGHGEQVAKARVGVKGQHIRTGTNPRYDAVEVNLTTLREWFHQQWYSYEETEENDDETRVVIEGGNYVETELPNGMTLRIVSVREEYGEDHELTFSDGANLIIKSPSKAHLSKFRETVETFRTMLAMYTGEWNRITEFSALRRGGEETNRYQWFEPQELAREPGRVHSFFMPLSYRDLESRFDQVVSHWFNRQNKIQEITDLYVPLVFGPPIPTEFYIIGLAQAFEGYHRYTVGGGYMDKESYESVRQALVEAIPEEVKTDHRRSMKNKIKYGYEFSLRRRLKELLEKLPDKLVKKVTDDPGRFPNQVADIRNELIHRGTGEQISESVRKEMPRLIGDMVQLATAIVFRELELPSDEIGDALNRLG